MTLYCTRCGGPIPDGEGRLGLHSDKSVCINKLKDRLDAATRRAQAAEAEVAALKEPQAAGGDVESVIARAAETAAAAAKQYCAALMMAILARA